MEDEKYPMQPPEPEYVSEKYILTIPYNDPHLEDKWKLRVYSAKLLKKQIKDEAQISSIKVRKPGLIAKTIAKIRGRIPEAKLLVTVKF